MPRQLPLDKPQLTWSATSGAERERTLLAVEIAVITPLFGGGAAARTADPLDPVRGAAVRGQLRAWWRAARAVGADFATSQQLFAAEAAIWGSPEHPAAVEVRVDLLDPGRPRLASAYAEQHRAGLQYALFPFLDMATGAGGPVRGQEGVRFRLTLTASPDVRAAEWPRLKQEAAATVFAWVTFGGIGARTRRGCGSLACTDPRFAPPGGVTDVAQWLTEQVGADRHLRSGDRLLPIPVLSGARLVVGDEPLPSLVAWNAALRRLREIRQEPGIARNRGQQTNRPGRSKWPEADSVREQLDLRDLRHPPEHRARPYFPRADLGLPLIFQRIARPEPRLEATGEGATRFASPVICKALALSPTHAVPLVLCLNAPHVWEGPGVALKQGMRSIPVPRANLDNDAKARTAATAMPELRGAAHATVLAYVANCWCREEVALP